MQPWTVSFTSSRARSCAFWDLTQMDHPTLARYHVGICQAAIRNCAEIARQVIIHGYWKYLLRCLTFAVADRYDLSAVLGLAMSASLVLRFYELVIMGAEVLTGNIMASNNNRFSITFQKSVYFYAKHVRFPWSSLDIPAHVPFGDTGQGPRH